MNLELKVIFNIYHGTGAVSGMERIERFALR